MYYTYKLVSRTTGKTHYTTNLLEAGQGYDILKMEDGTEIRFENKEMDGSNLTNEEYIIEKFDKYVVTQENLDNNAVLKALDIQVGAEVEYDPSVVISREDAIAQGIDVEAIEKRIAEAEETKNVSSKEVEKPEPRKIYEGKIIVSDTTREVGGKQYHHIRLDDGSNQDLTDEQYALIVIEK